MTFKYSMKRFRLRIPYQETELRESLKKIEGKRWHPEDKTWSVPASYRALLQLLAIGFSPSGDDETYRYLSNLEVLSRGDHRLGVPFGRTRKVAGISLLRFQEAGLDFLRPLSHALLYDEQGVGKTLQAVGWAKDAETVLVVAPRVVLSQWASYAEALDRPIYVQPETLASGWNITNYERLGRLLGNPDALIVDEVHYIKNPRSQRSKQVLALGNRSKQVLALSGTPIINNPKDLWPTYVLLKERLSSEWWGFGQRYCGAEYNGWGWTFDGATYLDELRDDMMHFALRREKSEVLADLPPKRRTTLVVETNETDKAEIEKNDDIIYTLVGQGVNLHTGVGFQAVQDARMRTAIAKVEGAAAWIAEHFENSGGPVAVFCSFIEPLQRIASLFPSGLFTGEQSESQREEAKRVFGIDTKVLCLTYGAGGMGLDGLQAKCDTALLLDLPWTPAELEQAEDRLHRMGQEKSVHIIRLLTNSRVEFRLSQALDRKENVIDALMRVE